MQQQGDVIYEVESTGLKTEITAFILQNYTVSLLLGRVRLLEQVRSL